MKPKSVLSIVLVAMLAIFAAVGCSGKEEEPPEEEPKRVNLTYDEFKEKAAEFTNISNYLASSGYDIAGKLAYGGKVYKLDASVDFSEPQDVVATFEFGSESEPSSALKMYLGAEKLFVELSKDGTVQRDSMTGVNNSLSDIIAAFAGGMLWDIFDLLPEASVFDYLVTKLVSEYIGKDVVLDFDWVADNAAEFSALIEDAEITYLAGDENYTVGFGYEGGTIDGTEIDPFDVDAEFDVKNNRIVDVTFVLTSEGTRLEGTLSERSALDAMPSAPSGTYEGTLLDEFEELYSNRNLTRADFYGEWSDGLNVLTIGEQCSFVSGAGEYVLTIGMQMSDFMLLNSGDDFYSVRLLVAENKIELTLPDETVLTLTKAEEEQ